MKNASIAWTLVFSAVVLALPLYSLCADEKSDADLKEAIAIYDGPADLLAQYDRSPLGRSV